VRVENALLGALIEEAQPVELAGDELTVAFAATAPFLKKKAEDPANRAAVTAALCAVTGGRWRLSYELRAELSAGEQQGQRGSSEEEWIRRFMEEFDAEELRGGWVPAQSGSSGAGADAMGEGEGDA